MINDEYYTNLFKYIKEQPDPMSLRCETCGKTYGSHSGWTCPYGKGNLFVLAGELKEDNPNVLFRRRRK